MSEKWCDECDTQAKFLFGVCSYCDELEKREGSFRDPYPLDPMLVEAWADYDRMQYIRQRYRRRMANGLLSEKTM